MKSKPCWLCSLEFTESIMEFGGEEEKSQNDASLALDIDFSDLQQLYSVT